MLTGIGGQSVQLAAQTIDSGAAKDRMESMIEVSQAG